MSFASEYNPIAAQHQQAPTSNNTHAGDLSPQSKASVGSPSANLASKMNIPHAIQEINGKQITVVWIDERRWMIGVQVAALLERETYNLYRSMKVKNIEVRRATVDQIEHLLKQDIVRTGTRSITFVSLDQSINFLAEELKKLEKKRQKAALIVSGQTSMNSNITPFFGQEANMEYQPKLSSKSAPTQLHSGDYAANFPSSFPPSQFHGDESSGIFDGHSAMNVTSSYVHQHSNFASSSFPSLSSHTASYPPSSSVHSHMSNSYSHLSSSYSDDVGPIKPSTTMKGISNERNMFHPY
eukprot:TRINITY_DN1378_c0_g1_i1.p1 TRINITY_DN1378_c0_g1~~TRINITY_DN1378_c0_g1_i1.p1  ORF type:complete len:297 (-),score=85.32 TRINITY_DN1378_c0_g1_i1:386-1276(-)